MVEKEDEKIVEIYKKLKEEERCNNDDDERILRILKKLQDDEKEG